MDIDESSGRISLQDICTPVTILIPGLNDTNVSTATSDLGSHSSSQQHKTGESLIISVWVRKVLFKYCKFVTQEESLDYGQALCEFSLEENNVTLEKQKWWNKHKKGIVKTLNEKRGCVVEGLKNIFKSK